jgi:hypothetical protein
MKIKNIIQSVLYQLKTLDTDWSIFDKHSHWKSETEFKIKYKTEQSCEDALLYLKLKYKKKFKCYKCMYCEAFHINYNIKKSH